MGGGDDGGGWGGRGANSGVDSTAGSSGAVGVGLTGSVKSSFGFIKKENE